MKTLLVLAQHPELAESIRSALNPEHYRIVQRLDVEEAEALLGSGLPDAVVLDVDMVDVRGMWAIEKLRRRLPHRPVLVFTGIRPWDWEEEAYVQGVAYVLAKPVRPRMLNVLLERLWSRPAGPPPARSVAARPAFLEATRPVETTLTAPQALQVLRDFSAILTHSLQADAMLRHFLLLLREILGVNRAAVFLRRPALLGGVSTLEGSRQMRSACALGLSPGLLEHFELSFEAGIGGFLFRQGRILRRESAEALEDLEVQKEFEILGAEVAVPMLDRESLVGVATFDGRVTGEPLTNGELSLIFHLLEQLGLAVKNIWLHDQLAANHEMMVEILRELSSACVVVSRDLTVLHANKTARRYFARAGRGGGALEFNDLPQFLGAKVYQVLQTGSAIAPFRFEPPESPATVYLVTIVPFQRPNGALPNAALLIVEDQTHAEHLQRLEVETSNLRLVRAMSDRLAHEVGNALTPLHVFQQELDRRLGDRKYDLKFLQEMNNVLEESVRRAARLNNQMRYLATDAVVTRETFPLAPLMEEAFQEAQQHQPVKSALLKYEEGRQPLLINGHRPALRHALIEVLLNALQANPAEAKVAVQARVEAGGEGPARLDIEIQDQGPGFTPEAVQKAVEPFYTTRTVGLGLGLTVCRKVLETHRGKLVIPNPKDHPHGVVHLHLPLEPLAGPEAPERPAGRNARPTPA